MVGEKVRSEDERGNWGWGMVGPAEQVWKSGREAGVLGLL